MGNTGFSRRDFLKSMVIAGVSIYIAAPFSRAFATLFEDNILQSPNWDPATRRVKNRLDAYAKITGQKVFAFDIRAKDMPHWPQEQSHAMILRVTHADKTYEGFDLSILEDGLMPDKIITAKDLERDHVTLPKFYGEDFLLPEGKTPAYLGQEVAILIYKDFARFRFAKDTLKFKDDVIRYGETTGFLERDPWSTYRSVRIGASNPFDPDIYSAMKYTTIEPLGYKKYVPFWPEGKEGGNLEQKGISFAEDLATEMRNPPEDWLVLDRELYSQSVDMCAMEPDNSNGWYDAETETLHMVVAVQSALDTVESLVDIMKHSTFKFKKLFLHPCTTVGYGAKARTMGTLLGTVATLYGEGRPVRLANDRYEQFQGGIKRHSFNMHFQLAVNKETHKIESFIGDFVLDGGGRCNYTPGVVAVGTTGVQGIYYIPKSGLTGVGNASRAVVAGSNRGYGTLQTMPALDTLLDEAASILEVDPVKFKLNNLMQSGMKNTQGAIPAGMMRGGEALSKCAEHPIWKDRESRKRQFENDNPGKILGIGIGCTQKDFGSGGEASFAKIELAVDGTISFWHSGLEIGSGMETSQTVVCARWFGVPADHSYFAIIEWPDLPMTTKVDGSLTQEKQDELSKNPLWSPKFSASTGASNSAYYFTHVTSEVGRILFDNGIWPAALSIWSEGIGGGQARPVTVRREDARWTEAGLTADGLQPLTLKQLAKRVYEMGGLTGAVGHGFNRWEWTEADYKIKDNIVKIPLDGLSLRWANDEVYALNKRLKVYYPLVQRNNAAVTDYTALAVVAEVSIDEATGEVKVENHHSVLECGNVIVPQLLSGQLEGGVAMGIGHALYEYLPLYEDGPGNGTWNFNRYHLPLASEVAVWKQTREILPPLSDTDPPKGMAEVAMISVVAAVTNAVADATGHYFYHHPIRPNEVLEVLNGNYV